MKIKEIINLSKKDKIETILKNLNKKGFYKFNSKLNEKIIDKSLEILEKESYNNKQETKTLFHKDAVNVSNLHLKNNFFIIMYLINFF